MSEYTKGEWVNGYGDGITGPTTPTISGPTVQEAIDHRTWLDGDMKSEAPIDLHTVVSCREQTIAIVPTYYPGGEANARLIAAAPDLLKTIKNALASLAIISMPNSGLGDVATNDELLKIMGDSFRAAITKTEEGK